MTNTDKIADAKIVCRRWGDAHFKTLRTSQGDNASAMSLSMPKRRVVNGALGVPPEGDPYVRLRRLRTGREVILRLSDTQLALLRAEKMIVVGEYEIQKSGNSIYVEYVEQVSAQGKQRRANQESREPDWPEDVELLDKVLSYMKDRGYAQECTFIRIKYLNPSRAREDIARKYGLKVYGYSIGLTKYKKDQIKAENAVAIFFDEAKNGSLNLP